MSGGRVVGFWAGALLVVAAGQASAAEVFVPYRVLRADGAYVDWLDGHAGITGRAVSYHDLNKKVFFSEAKSAAEDNGRERLLSFLREIAVDGVRRLGDDPDLIGRVKTRLDGTESLSYTVNTNSVVTVAMKVPLSGPGGLLELLLPAGASPQTAETATTQAAGGSVTGLVLDASRIAGAAPSLLPRILDDKGRLVYAAERVDIAAARQRGLAAFGIRVELKQQPAAPAPRQGDAPLRVEATGVGKPAGTDFIVSTPDADRILHAAAESPFLRQCRVLILLPASGPGGPAKPAGKVPPHPTPPAARPRGKLN